MIIRPKHVVTWTGEKWECICSFESDDDVAAQDHYLNSFSSPVVASLTEFEVGTA